MIYRKLLSVFENNIQFSKILPKLFEVFNEYDYKLPIHYWKYNSLKQSLLLQGGVGAIPFALRGVEIPVVEEKLLLQEISFMISKDQTGNSNELIYDLLGLYSIEWMRQNDLEGYVGYPIKDEYDLYGLLIIFSSFYNAEREKKLRDETVRLLVFGLLMANQREELHRKYYHSVTIFNTMPAMAFITDGDGIISHVSDKWLVSMGYDRNEVIGKNVEIYLSETTREIIYEQYLNRLNIEENVYDLEIEFTKKDGENIVALLSGIVELDGTGKISSIINIMNDVTESKQTEIAFRQNEWELRRLNKRLENYSHSLEQKVFERTKEVIHRRQVADSLRDILSVLNSNHPLEKILDYIAIEAGYFLDSSTSAIFRYYHDHNRFQIVSVHGDSSDIVSKVSIPFEWARVLTKGQPIAVFDIFDQEANIFALANEIDELENCCHSILVVPLTVLKEVYGCLALFFCDPRHFQEEEIELASAFGIHVSLAIENARLRQRANQAAVMEERGRLARELHDSVTQSLYSLTLLTEGWRRMAVAGRLENIVDPFMELGDVAQQALKEMRLLVYELRPPLLENEGLIGTLHQRISTVEKRAGIETRLYSEGVIDLPPQIEEGLYRIAQEALNNSLKHAEAENVTIRFFVDGNKYLTMEISDDGIGFEVQKALLGGGMGLRNMQERAEKLRGKVFFDSQLGVGTTVKTRIEISEVKDG